MTTLSIILATHNALPFLDRAIESVLTQTFADFEFIIFDDGSTDGTLDRLRQFAARDARIKLVEQENAGLTITLNRALALATGKYVARMDADDFCFPNRLQLQIDFLKSHPEVVLLGSGYELIDEKDRRLHVMRPPTDDATLQQHCLNGTTPICHPTAMFRTDAARQVNGYDESFPVAQDLDFWLRLGEVGKMACLPDVLIQYRMHAKSISEKKQSLQIECMRRACESAYKRRNLQGSFKGADGWRANGSENSSLRQILQFGWWAWHLGESRTARAYGLRAIQTAPFKSDGYRLLTCGMFKSPGSESSGSNR